MLELKNLSVGYSGYSIIQNVNLVFQPGMISTIIGKNGSGKSTLLKTCSGLLPPKAGSVFLNKVALEQYSHINRAKTISYLPQNTNIPNITVERLLAQNTPVMLLDEPTTYLDIEYQFALMELLQKQKMQNKTIIMVLHDLQLALNYRDRIIVIDSGQVCSAGTPNEFLDNGILQKVFHVEVKTSFPAPLRSPGELSFDRKSNAVSSPNKNTSLHKQ